MRFLRALVIVAVSAACSTSGSGNTPASTSVTPVTTTTTLPTTTTVATTSTTQPTTTTTPTPPETVEVNAPEGWTVYHGPNSALAAPEGWVDGKKLIEDPEAIEGGLDALGNEALASFFEGIGDETLELIDVLLIDSQSLEEGFATNLNVIAAPVGPITDLVTIEQAIRVQIGSFGGEVVGTSVEDIAGTETLIIDYTIPSDQGVITAQQYHQLSDGQLLTTTFTGQEREPGAWRAILETVTPVR